MQTLPLKSDKPPVRRRKPGANATTTVDCRITLACRLDRNADLLLSRNCHIAAERLSLRAQVLRETSQ